MSELAGILEAIWPSSSMRMSMRSVSGLLKCHVKYLWLRHWT